VDVELGMRLLLDKGGRIGVEAESRNHEIAVALGSVY
jgi:hypothetical protein